MSNQLVHIRENNPLTVSFDLIVVRLKGRGLRCEGLRFRPGRFHELPGAASPESAVARLTAGHRWANRNMLDYDVDRRERKVKSATIRRRLSAMRSLFKTVRKSV